MSNKNSKTDLVLTSAENLADEILFKTANTFLENAAKSIPFASLISSSIQAYTRFRTLKEQKQLLFKKQKPTTMLLLKISLKIKTILNSVWKYLAYWIKPI